MGSRWVEMGAHPDRDPQQGPHWQYERRSKPGTDVGYPPIRPPGAIHRLLVSSR
jgi:hypothetical protein